MTMYDLLETARRELKERFEELISGEEPDSSAALEAFSDKYQHDSVFEVADSHVPVYTEDLLMLALDNLELAHEKPGLGPAYDGLATPHNLIAANVAECIEQDLFEYWRELTDQVVDNLDGDPDPDDDPQPDDDDPEPAGPARRLPVAGDDRLIFTCAHCGQEKARMYGPPPLFVQPQQQTPDLLAAIRHTLVCRSCQEPARRAA